MDLDHHPVRPDRDAAEREWLDEPALPGGMRRIDDHRQVGEVVEERDRGEVHRVARVGLERADAALAQDDVGVAAADDVLRRHQPFLDGRAVAALEHHRAGDASDVAQQRVVLHVPGADLEDVGVLGDDVDLVGLHDLGDHRKPRPVARLGEIPKRLDAEALEGVRARPGLERAAAQDRGTGGGDRIGGLEQLVAALHRARAGHHRERPVADDRVEDADDRVLGVELPRGQLERLADRRDRVRPRAVPRTGRSAPVAARRSRRRRAITTWSAPTWSYGVSPSARIWLLTPRTSASVALVAITTNIALRFSSSVGRPNKKAEVSPLPRSPGTTRAPGLATENHHAGR